MTASSVAGRVKGFNEGMEYARYGKTFENHPLHGLDVKQEYDVRVKGYDDLVFPLQNMLRSLLQLMMA